MKAMLAMALLLLSTVLAALAQEACDTAECLKEERDMMARTLELLVCELNEESWERDTCALRHAPARRTCQSKTTPQEQIQCLEQALDTVIRSLPAIIAGQIRKELQPRLHQ